MNYLVAHNLSFAHGATPVLREVCLSVARGRVVGLVGPSGTGKSTLLWLLAGLLRPSQGRVAIASSPEVHDVRPVDPRHDTIGMVFQQPALWDHLSVESHLDLVLRGRNLTRAQRRSRVDAILGSMRLFDLRRRRPGQLSGGQQQRVALARALVIDPCWLLLDEPLAHLDGPTHDEVFDLLRQALAQRYAGVLMATHEPAEALRMTDDIAVLLNGRIAQFGPVRQVYEHPLDLSCARVLGPATLLNGVADHGALLREGRAILEAISPALTGPQSLVLRPHHLAFVTDPAGLAQVSRSDLTATGYHLNLQLDGTADAVQVQSDVSLAPGTRGRLRLKSNDKQDIY